MFVFVRKLNYANGCLSSIFYVAATVLLAQDAHVGSKLNAAASVIGPLWFGAVLGGLAVSLAPQFLAHSASLCWSKGLGNQPMQIATVVLHMFNMHSSLCMLASRL